jgi:hypothetical protein
LLARYKLREQCKLREPCIPREWCKPPERYKHRELCRPSDQHSELRSRTDLAFLAVVISWPAAWIVAAWIAVVFTAV